MGIQKIHLLIIVIYFLAFIATRTRRS